ncbi:MAG: hypothetical protein P8Y45_10390 [Exilibacterium sp.]
MDAKLVDGEGYLLLAVDTSINLDFIHITGTKSARLTSDDLQKGSRYILIKLPAGNYEFNKIQLSNVYNYSMKSDIWRFEVKENAVNYIGNLMVRHYDFGSRAYFELINRSSFALQYLNAEFPNILNGRTVEYGGPGEDDFFSTVRINDSEGSK